MNAFMVLTVAVFGFYVLLTSSSSSSGYSDEPFGANRIQTIGIRASCVVSSSGLCGPSIRVIEKEIT